VLVVDGTYNFSEPLEDWTWYTVSEDSHRPMTYHRVDDLVPDSFYELQVIAVNELGHSDVDSQFIFSTAAQGAELLLIYWIYSMLFNASAKIFVGSHRIHRILRHWSNTNPLICVCKNIPHI